MSSGTTAPQGLGNPHGGPPKQSRHGNGRDNSIPEQVPVICGDCKGQLLVRQGRIRHKGNEMSPTVFERLGGKASAKKWKNSVRVLLSDDTAGGTIGDWLQEHGVDIRNNQVFLLSEGSPPTNIKSSTPTKQTNLAGSEAIMAHFEKSSFVGGLQGDPTVELPQHLPAGHSSNPNIDLRRMLPADIRRISRDTAADPYGGMLNSQPGVPSTRMAVPTGAQRPAARAALLDEIPSHDELNSSHASPRIPTPGAYGRMALTCAGSPGAASDMNDMDNLSALGSSYMWQDELGSKNMFDNFNRSNRYADNSYMRRYMRHGSSGSDAAGGYPFGYNGALYGDYHAAQALTSAPLESHDYEAFASMEYGNAMGQPGGGTAFVDQDGAMGGMQVNAGHMGVPGIAAQGYIDQGYVDQELFEPDPTELLLGANQSPHDLPLDIDFFQVNFEDVQSVHSNMDHHKRYREQGALPTTSDINTKRLRST